MREGWEYWASNCNSITNEADCNNSFEVDKRARPWSTVLWNAVLWPQLVTKDFVDNLQVVPWIGYVGSTNATMHFKYTKLWSCIRKAPEWVVQCKDSSGNILLDSACNTTKPQARDCKTWISQWGKTSSSVRSRPMMYYPYKYLWTCNGNCERQDCLLPKSFAQLFINWGGDIRLLSPNSPKFFCNHWPQDWWSGNIKRIYVAWERSDLSKYSFYLDPQYTQRAPDWVYNTLHEQASAPDANKAFYDQKVLWMNVVHWRIRDVIQGK